MNFNRPLILASNSPRRQSLLTAIGLDFTVRIQEVDETYPPEIPPDKVALFLAQKKAQAYLEGLNDEILITADTVVKLKDMILGKPTDYDEAFSMLSQLSGKTHEVITGVCIAGKDREVIFDDVTRVHFRDISPAEIDYYITHYTPYDKAGSYGIQELLPQDANICSPEELQFISQINRPALFEESINRKAGKGITAIDKIEGSYFNVVGLPIRKVYMTLNRMLSKR